MKIIVTGATGFVGKNLVQELLQQHHDVVVIVRDRKRIPIDWNEKVKVIEATLEELSNIESNEKADVFFHFAWAGTSGMERADVALQLANVEATCNAVHLAKKFQCKRFVNAGSIMEYEAMQYIPSDEAKPGIGNIYSTAKMTADFMAKIVATNLGIEYINVIISNIYGAGEKSVRFFNTTLRKMIKNERIPLTNGTQLYDFIYVTDAVKQMIIVSEKGKANSTYYIGNSKQYPLKHYITNMKNVLKSDSELLFGEVPFNGALLSYQEFDTRKMDELGFKQEVSFERGVELTRDWILEEENAN